MHFITAAPEIWTASKSASSCQCLQTATHLIHRTQQGFNQSGGMTDNGVWGIRDALGDRAHDGM